MAAVRFEQVRTFILEKRKSTKKILESVASCRSRIQKIAISNKICDMKTTSILCREYKKLPSAKNILGDFCFVQFSIVLLAAQIIAKSESDIDFSGCL